MEENLYSLYRLCARHSQGEISSCGSYEWVDGSPSGWPRYLYNLSSEKDYVEVMRGSVARHEEGPSRLILGAQTSPTLLQYIRERYQLVREWAGMCLSFADNAVEPKREILEVRRVSSNRELDTWTHLMNTTFYGRGSKTAPDLFHRLARDPSVILFVGYYEGNAVATSMGYLREGVIGVYNITTLEQYRGKGLGGAVTQAILDEGRRCGCRGAILHARPAASGLYASLGFNTIAPISIFDLSLQMQ